MRSIDRIAYIAQLEPELPAVIAGGSVVTFGMLEAAVRGITARLIAFGLAPGSLVGVSIKAPARHLAMSLALLRTGLCAAPFHNEVTLAALPPLSLVLAEQSFGVPGGQPCIVVGDDWFAPGDAVSPTLPSLPAGTPARLAMSSGSTGTPKPLLLSRAALDWRVLGAEPQLSVAGQWSRGLAMMDLASIWGLSNALAPLGVGRTLCFAANPVEALRVMSLYGCDYLMGSVFQLRELVAAQRTGFVPLPQLRTARIGGSAISAALIADIQALLARRIVLSYGSSELGIAAVELVGGAPVSEGAAGYPHPDIELEVVDADGQPLPAGTEGRVRLRAEHMATQVDGSPLSPDGWFYPGDIGRRDAGGRLFITGRETELINVGGGKIAPERVEAMLLRHPKVRDAGVVGVKDPRGGEAIVAAVVAGETLDLAELTQFAATHFPVAPISRFVLVAAIPRGLTSKVQRAELRALLQQ